MRQFLGYTVLILCVGAFIVLVAVMGSAITWVFGRWCAKLLGFL